MNWDAIGAVAELLAAIGVIFSFMYLASQIRQNTRAQKRSNLREIAEDHTTTLRSTATNPELASLVLKAHADLSSLDAVERYRFDAFFYAWLSSLERALLDARDGEYPEEMLAPLKIVIAGFLRTKGGRAWWEECHVFFTKYGQEAISNIVEDQTIDDRNTGPPT